MSEKELSVELKRAIEYIGDDAYDIYAEALKIQRKETVNKKEFEAFLDIVSIELTNIKNVLLLVKDIY